MKFEVRIATKEEIDWLAEDGGLKAYLSVSAYRYDKNTLYLLNMSRDFEDFYTTLGHEATCAVINEIISKKASLKYDGLFLSRRIDDFFKEL